MALSEGPLLDAELLAIEEINRQGGVLGSEIEALVPDCASLPERFVREAQDCLACGAMALFGCWTSASRKAVRPIVEAAESLLWYPVQYEGLEESSCICYSGSCLNQQILPAVEWTLENFGNHLLLLGSDYVFPRAANQLIRSLVTSHGGCIVDERYFALGTRVFDEVIARIRETRPSAVINTINGDSNLAFYRQYREAGIDPARTPVIATSVTETELRPIAAFAEGNFACWSYFQSLDTPENRDFLDRFKRRHGQSSSVSAPVVTAYSQLYLWKQAVERAGTFVPREVRRYLEGCSLLSPMGEVRIESNHHLSLPVRIGRLKADGQFDIIWGKEERVAPLPWLGIETMDFPGREMVRQSMAAFADNINYSLLLEQEIVERKALEAALEETQAKLEEKVEERTQQLVRSIDDLSKEVAEHKVAEEALEANEEILRTILDNSRDGINLLDLETGCYSFISPAQAELTGFSIEELRNFPAEEVFERVHPEDRERLISQQSRVAAGEELTAPAEYRWKVKSGEYRWFGDTRRAIRNREGKITAMVGVIRDITERKRSEHEKEMLESQNRQLQKSESLGRMAAAIAHHFNNRLQAVLGNLELARIELPPEAGESAKFLTSAIDAGRHASEVSGLMLAYLGQSGPAQTPADLTDVCRLCMPMLQAAMPKAAELEMDFPAHGPAVSANANQIQQILANLITNAWESSQGAPCSIRVSVRTAASGDIARSHRFPVDFRPDAGSYACLEIRDSGGGIAADKMDDLFDPFYTTKFTGRGMGLPVVLGIVRAHRGVITVESELGRGSTFHIYLPMIEAPVAPLMEKAAGSGKLLGDATVLLIEDEEMIRRMTATMLSRLGFEVLTAKDGIEGVEVFRSHKEEIRCIICDLTMPRMGGWETMAALKQMAPGIPVILASGSSEAHVMSVPRPERPEAFLSKPYNRDRLSAALRIALARNAPKPGADASL